MSNFIGQSGQLFSNPHTSSADEISLMSLWNADPNTPSSQTTSAIQELAQSSDRISRLTGVLLDSASPGNYSSQTQRDLLYALDHDSNTRTDFGAAALDALHFALNDTNSQVTASDRSALQANLGTWAPQSWQPTFVYPGSQTFNGDLVTDNPTQAQTNIAKGYNPNISTSSVNVDGIMGDASGPPPGMENCTYVSSHAFLGANTGGTLVFGQSTTDGHRMATYEGVDAQYHPLQLSFNATGLNGQWSDSDLQKIHDGILQSWGNDSRHNISMQTLRAAIGEPNGQNTLGESEQPGGLAYTLSGNPAAGDCFVLSPIDALANTPGGTQKLLSCITPTANGSYSVTFPGDPDHKAYEVTQADISGGKYDHSSAYNQFSLGDIPTSVLAIAMNKYALDHNEPSIMGGGQPDQVLTLLTGKQSSVVDKKSNDPNSITNIENIIKKELAEGAPVTVVEAMKPGLKKNLTDAVSGNHVLTLKAYDPATDMLTWTNPWDSTKEYQQTLTSFMDHADDKLNDFENTVGIDYIDPNAPAGTTTDIIN